MVAFFSFRLSLKMAKWSDQFREMSHLQELPSIASIQNNLTVKRLKKRLFNLEKIYFNAQTIMLEGCEHLRSIPGQHWRSTIYSLFFDAGLPRFYILNMYTHNIIDTVPSTIIIQLISYRVKLYVNSVLLDFFSSQNKNNMEVIVNS